LLPLVIALIAACTSGGGVATIDTSVTDPLTDPNLEVVASGAIACADPSLREQAVFDDTSFPGEAEKKAWFWGGGIITGDVTNDGVIDMILPGFWTTYFYEGRADGTFVDITDRLLELPVRGASGGSVADFDGDGDLDVLVTRYQQRNTLLRNDDGVLVDVTDAAGIPVDMRRTMSSSWGDFDADGDLDLFLGNYGYIDESREDDDPDHLYFEPAEPSWLLRNNGDGTFDDISTMLPQQVHDGYTFSGGFVDVDRDGALDLYVVNDFGNSYPNVYLHNVDGELVFGDQLGLDVAITGMGVGIGDLNDDGLPDFAMTAWNGNYLMESANASLWVDHAQADGFMNDLERTQKVGWGVELADMDNDGDLDAPMAYGYLDSTYIVSLRQPDAMYMRDENGRFSDVGAAWGLNHPTVGRGFALVDANNDGWLDVIKRDLDGPTLYSKSRCSTASWLRLRLHDPTTPNRFAVGARVTVHVGGRTMERTVYAGTVNHASGGPPEVHFGLGGNDRADSIDILWPDGHLSTRTQP
jgi:enediyne biosynthesis protein E4